MNELRNRINQKRSNGTRVKDAFKNEEGAIDLASIMVGIIVIGLVGGVIAATVFAIIPWAQDNAAKQQLDSVSSAESAYVALTSSSPSALPATAEHRANSYGSSVALESAGLLKQDKSFCAIPSADGKDYQAIVKSKSSNLFSISSKNTKPAVFTGTLPEDCSFLYADESSGVAAAKDTITTLTYLCDVNWKGEAVTETGTLPMQDNINGKLSIKSGSVEENRDLSKALTSGSISMKSGVTYTVTLDGTYDKFNSTTNQANGLSLCLRSVDHWGMDTGVTDASYGLANLSKLTSVPSQIPSTITNMSGMFASSHNFNSPNISKWDVSNVTNMNAMFSASSAFNQPLDKWDTSKVTNMDYMFASALVFNQNITGWDLTANPSHASFTTFGYSALTAENSPKFK